MNFILLSNCIVYSANSAANTIRYVYAWILGLIDWFNFLRLFVNYWWLNWDSLSLGILDVLRILLIISRQRGGPLNNIKSLLVGLIHMVWQF